MDWDPAVYIKAFKADISKLHCSSHTVRCCRTTQSSQFHQFNLKKSDTFWTSERRYLSKCFTSVCKH